MATDEEKLLKAAGNEDAEGVRRLLDAGVDVNAVNNKGQTALHLHVQEVLRPTRKYVRAVRSPDVIDVLLEHGADVNAKSNAGNTALHVTAHLLTWSQRLPAMKAMADRLLEHGAVPVIANNEGQTPLDYAIQSRWGDDESDDSLKRGLVFRMLLPSGALVHLAQNAAGAHEQRLKRIVKGLKNAVESPGFLELLADTLAGVRASGRLRGKGAMLKALFRQLDAFAEAADDGTGEAQGAPLPQAPGDAHEERRRLAVVQSPEFLSELAEGLAGVNMYDACRHSRGFEKRVRAMRVDDLKRAHGRVGLRRSQKYQKKEELVARLLSYTAGDPERERRALGAQPGAAAEARPCEEGAIAPGRLVAAAARLEDEAEQPAKRARREE